MTRAAYMSLRACALVFGATALTGCFDRISAPECNRVSFSQASVSGDTITTTTGLRYIEGTVGSGIAADWCRNVVVHYEGFLLDGTKFDGTRDADTPLLFAPGLAGLIAGFEQGVIGMRVGGTRRLILPPELAFGSTAQRDASGQVVIPANSTVVFDIEVLAAGE
jgi:FKBP-type peptidyl-prolyl cis-trans isomerase